MAASEAELKHSDCFETCLNTLGCSSGQDSVDAVCDLAKALGNGVCEETYAVPECGWDQGDCGFCAFGCFESDLGNGSCDPSCSSKECEFDMGDCVLTRQGYCAPNCFVSMLGNGNCDSACATADCDYDQGDCEYLVCQPGCYPDMVNDGVCNQSCHVEECEWDGWDCDCAPGCTAAKLSNSQCDLECAVAACDFDASFCVSVTQGNCALACFDFMLGDGQCNSSCNVAECEWDWMDCGCAPGCSFSDLGTCKKECLVPECQYDASHLLASLSFTCAETICVTDAVLGITTLCTIAIPHCAEVPYSVLTTCCSTCCQAGYSTLPSQPQICIRTPDTSSMTNPQVLHMSNKSLCAVADGSLDCPYVGFAQTVPRLWARYTVIYMLPGVHLIEPAGFLIQSKAKRTSPRLLPNITPSLRHLTIRPASVRPTLQISTTAAPYFYVLPNMTLLFTDIDFTSSVNFNLCGSLFQCSTLDDLFYVPREANLVLTSLIFRDFRRAMTSVIFLDGGFAKLNNVDFTRIIIRQSNYDISAVIRANTAFSRLEYRGGTVSLLNNALDYVYTLYSFGFFQGDVGSLLLESITFELNFVDVLHENERYNSGSLIFLGRCGKCVIQNSTFLNNIGNNGALIRYKSTKWEATSTDYDTALEIIEGGLYLENCVFRNNTGNRGLLLVEYLSDLQTVKLTNCSFESELSRSYGVVSVESDFLGRKGSRGVTVLTENSAGRKALLLFPPAQITFTNITFVNCTYSLMHIRNVPLVTLAGVRIERKNKEESPTRYSTTLAAFESKPYAYLPAGIPDDPAPSCLSVLNISYFTHIVVDQLTFQDMDCEAGVVLLGQKATIANSRFDDNTGNWTFGSTLVLFATNATLSNLHFYNNTNFHPRGSGVVSLFSTQLALLSSSFSHNHAAFGAGAFLNATSVLIETCLYEANSAVFAGGGLLLQFPNFVSTVQVHSSRFLSNSAGKSGGAMSLTPLGSSCSVQVEIGDSVFEENESPMGAVLDLKQGVDLAGGLFLRNTKVTGNTAIMGGELHVNQAEGLVVLHNCSFAQNVGTRGAILYRNCLVACSVQLSAVVLADNQGQTMLDVASAGIITIEAEGLLCEHNQGTCLDLKQGNFTCIGCIFTSNRATEGGAFHIVGGSAHFINASFRSNQALRSGGAGLLDHAAALICSHCAFFNNSAQWQGGALAAQYASTVLFTATRFERNYAKDSGFALLMFLCQSSSSVTSSQFIGNSGAGFGVIVLLTAALSISDSSFESNESSSLTGGVMLHTSTISMHNCQFEHQVSYSGTFLYLVNSAASVRGSTLSRGRALVSGGGIYAIDSQVVLDSLRLENLESDIGAAVILQKGAQLFGSNCTFEYVRTAKPGRGIIDSTQSTVILSNSQFHTYQESAIAGVQSYVSLLSVQFSKGHSTAGGGLSWQQGTHLSILNCSFEELEAGVGGAVYVSGGSGDGWVIEGVMVRNNAAAESGGIHVEEANITIRNSVFQANSANGSNGRGGAVTLLTQSLNVSVTLLNCTFLHNSATWKGGALCWEGRQPTLAFNTFLANVARYGADIASYAVRLEVPAGTVSGLESIASGQLVKGVLELVSVDHYGEVVVIDSSSFAELSSAEENTTLAGVLRTQCAQGKFFFANFSITALPGSNTSLVITPTSVPATGVASFSSQAFSLPVSMRKCTMGEAQSQLQCVLCQSGTYSLDPSSSCKNCPSSALCYGNFTLVPRPGYWRVSTKSDRFFECPNHQACLGSPEAPASLNMTGECAEGYEGIKCQSCKPGFYQWGYLYCSHCPTLTAAIPALLGGTLALTLLLVAVVAVKLREEREDYMSVKIVVSYAQVVMLLGAFDLSWPRVMLELFGFQEAIGAFPEFPFSGNCVLSENSQKDAYYLKLLILACSQPGLVLISCVVWAVLSFCKGKMRILSPQMLASSVILFFLAYPSVLRGVLSVYHCEDIEDEEWLVGKPIKCWDSEHLKYALGLALPCVLLWGFAVPLLVLLAMVRQAHRSERVWDNFFTHGYRVSWRYWEFCTCALKFVLIAVSILLTRISAAFKALVAMAVLVCYFVLVRSASPYCLPSFTRLEATGTLTVITTLYSGLCYHTNILGTGSQVTLTVAIISLNALYTGWCLRTLVVSFLYLLSHKLKHYFYGQPLPVQPPVHTIDTRVHASISEDDGMKFTSEPAGLAFPNL